MLAITPPGATISSQVMKLAGTPTASMAVSTPRPPVIFKTFSTALPSLLLMTAGIMLKIETKTAFNQLPDLLLRAMRHPPIAVMIARGDLGVEVGFERLSEVQEEILW